MAVDFRGEPIFATEPLTALTGLTLPTAAAAATHPLQSVIDSISTPTSGGAPPLQSLLDSISAPKLASVPTSNTLSLLLGALGNRANSGSGASTGQQAFAQIPASTKAAVAANKALTQIGVPYKWGGNSWGSALDCSGLVQQSFKRVGVSVPRTTYDQWKTGSAVSKGKLQAGDAVFFHPGKNGPEHVGIYIGNDQFVAAPHTGADVHTSKLSTYGGYMGARRYG